MILLKNILHDGAPVNLFIDGQRIFRILPAPDTGGIVPDETLDCTGKAVIPGFINMHTHAAMILLRGITEDVPLHQWLSRIWEIEARIDERFTSKLAFQAMIDSGLKKKQRRDKAMVDQIAATIMLQDYMRSLNPSI